MACIVLWVPQIRFLFVTHILPLVIAFVKLILHIYSRLLTFSVIGNTVSLMPVSALSEISSGILNTTILSCKDHYDDKELSTNN